MHLSRRASADGDSKYQAQLLLAMAPVDLSTPGSSDPRCEIADSFKMAWTLGQNRPPMPAAARSLRSWAMIAKLCRVR
jgi:hypothetical protein